MRWRRRAYLALALVLAGSVAAAHSTDHGAQVDQLFAKWDRKDSAGCVVLVRQDGKTLHERAYGMANLELGVPLTATSVFLLASVSKQFVVFLIMLLAQSGRVGLDDDVRKYLPELPDFGKTITIRHLIQHTSGLREDLTLFNLAGWRGEDAVTRDDFLRLVKNQKELNFEPGSKYTYCNTGYHLLAIIVERVAGKPFAQVARDEIFAPLGMTQTVVRDDYRLLIPKLATGYNPKGPGFQLRPLLHGPPGASNVHSTVRDLALWEQNFYDGKVGGLKLLQTMQEKGKLNDGSRIAYGGGLSMGSYRALKTVSHTGSHGGYKTVMLRFPEQRFAVIVLANERTFNPMRMAEKVAGIYLSEQLKPLPPLPTAIKVDAKVLDELAGVYKTGPGLLDVRRENGRLVVQSQFEKKTLAPFADEKDVTEFFERADGTRYRFVRSNTGLGLVITTAAGQKSPLAPRLEFAEMPAAKLAHHAGTFWSDELETFGSIVLRDGKLFLRLPKAEHALRPLANGEFLARPTFTSWVTLRFTMNASGQADGYALSTERVRNLRYARVRIEPQSR